MQREFFGPRWQLWGAPIRVEVNAQGKDPEKAARLWQVSEQLTSVHYEALGKPALAHV